MVFLVLKLMDLVEALLNHFVDVYDTALYQAADGEWYGTPSSVLTEKGNETVGAVASIVHLGSIMLAQLMVVLVYPFYVATNLM